MAGELGARRPRRRLPLGADRRPLLQRATPLAPAAAARPSDSSSSSCTAARPCGRSSSSSKQLFSSPSSSCEQLFNSACATVRYVLSLLYALGLSLADHGGASPGLHTALGAGEWVEARRGGGLAREAPRASHLQPGALCPSRRPRSTRRECVTTRTTTWTIPTAAGEGAHDGVRCLLRRDVARTGGFEDTGMVFQGEFYPAIVLDHHHFFGTRIKIAYARGYDDSA